jgi:acetyl-CoA carboxylase carboxyl transferase subunit alpha
MEMMTLQTPILTILIGEGGSGGALALSVADEVWMLENAIYSVISPEGCANILWKNVEKAPEAAESLRLTAADVHGLGVVERIIPERDGNFPLLYESLGYDIRRWCEKSASLTPQELTRKRYRRFREIGARRA